jgi:TonB family protein
MALLVNAQGNVDQIKVLRTTGSSRLDKAAVSAVRQCKFAADKSVARSEPMWGQVSLRFAPPQRLLRIPVIVMPYAWPMPPPAPVTTIVLPVRVP